jgi:hypothetical protein
MPEPKKKQYRKQAIILAALYAAGAIFFFNTSPDKLPLLLLILPFLYIFLVLYLTVLLACRLLQVKNTVFVALVISVFGVLLFVLGSLHQLTLRDVIISLALTSVLTWYATRVSRS